MSFKNIKGQDKPIDMLKRCLKSSCASGAYLFMGAEGIGKYLTARTFAKAVNCLNEDDDSCDSCLSCLKIDKNQYPDIHLIELRDSDDIKIESIRQLKKDISLKPYAAKKKVFIINDAHNLTSEAQNALLKILEEPPPDSLIILISSKAALLFKTIISRCKLIRFYPLERQALGEILKKDCGFDDSRAHYLAYFSEGRIGCALRLKDTDIFSEKNRIIDEFSVFRKPVLDNAQKQTKQDLRIQLNVLARWFRDIYLLKIGIPYSEIINLDRKTELLSSVNRYSTFDLEEIMNSISDSALRLEQNINLKLLVSNLKLSLVKNQ